MKNQSLVDLFDLYDLTFDEICQELNVTDIPTWQQRWFYRYYQVNLLPQITFLLYNNTDAIELQNVFKKYKDQYECESIYETNQKFYSTFVDSFPNWWFKRARNYFVNKKDKVSPIIGIRFDDELKPAYLSSAMNFFQNEVKSIFKKKHRPTHLILSIPIRNSKKETCELFENYLDGTIFFSNYQRHYGKYTEGNPYNQTKNKIPLKTIKDCFRLLEYMSIHPHEDLVTIAKNSGILEFSRSNLDSSRSAESINSIRVGTNRLINLTSELLHANAYGFFPEPKKFETRYHTFSQKVKEIFPLLTSKSLFESAKSFLPKREQMKQSIRKDMLQLKSDGFLD